ncbi:MAG: glycosyltransferase, partial [Verrucomicrobiaceae bacterium]|nr:glycosyltransferase [Verrucomicrobiaceae bacterium]
QPKRGFVFPFEKWMQEDWHKSFADIGRVLPGPNPTWYQRWAVFMLQNWATKNGVNASSLSPGPKTTVAASSSLPTTTKPLSPIHFWVPGIREGSGGIQGFCRDVLQALKVSFPGRPIHVLIKNDEPEAGDTLFGGLVTWSSSQNTPAKLRTAGFALKGLLACVRQRPAFILSGHVNFLPAVHSLKRGFGTPFAVFMYGIDVWEPLSRRVRSALRSADLVCSISRYTTAQASKAQGINSLSIVPFPCTFNDERYVPGPKPPHLLQRYGLRADQPVIFTVSRLAATERYKGHEQVLDALHEVSRRFPDLCYIIGGTGDYAHVLRARAAELGLADRVIFAGFIPNDELCAHYQLCDVFIMPSRKEGFGIVFVEAASCGKPVIGGNQDGSVDALADGKIGVLVDPADVPGIAQAIIQTLDKTHPNTLLFDPHALHEVTANTFGPQAFQTRLRDLLTPYL